MGIMENKMETTIMNGVYRVQGLASLSVRQTRKDSAGEEEEGEVEVVLGKVVVRIGGSIRRRTTEECTSSATTTACLLLS